MSTAGKKAGKKQSVPAKKSISKTGSALPSAQRDASPKISIRSILDVCIGASSLVEITINSLEAREIGDPEQEVLRHALKVIWSIHDFIHEATSNEPDDNGDHEADEP